VPAPVVRPTIQPRVKPISSTPTPTVATQISSFLDKNRLDAILAQAQANQEAAAREAAAAVEARALQAVQAEIPKRRSEVDGNGPRRKKTRVSSEEKREKRLTKLVGEFVVKTMSKYQYMMERETFKKYAQEVSVLLVACLRASDSPNLHSALRYWSTKRNEGRLTKKDNSKSYRRTRKSN
jgi:hypothetical protein